MACGAMEYWSVGVLGKTWSAGTDLYPLLQYSITPVLRDVPSRQSQLTLSAVRLRAVAFGLSAIGFGPQAGGELVAADFAIVALATTAEKATSRPS
jgi:hypothetical protein